MEKEFSLEKIKDLALDILKEVSEYKEDQACVLAFFGDLGAGKTTITKEIASHLGVDVNVISPTFVIMKNYKTKNSKFKNLIHIDAYRLDNHEDIFVLGWEELLKNKDNLIIVEWPEKISKYLPKAFYSVILEHKDETTRKIKFCYN